MNEALARWNQLSIAEAESEIVACCGSRAWAREMARRRPLADETEMLTAADAIWGALNEADWTEAFRSHPRIGESSAEQPVHAQAAAWSAQEQRSVSTENDDTVTALAEGNREYERRFGWIFVVCATGKSGAEILKILRQRLHNDAPTELIEAAEQQRQITQIRLKTWLQR
jgi:2-oxo-4-hydroxy-4-carboxy-5-ureidoimidazoline decarboxylase